MCWPGETSDSMSNQWLESVARGTLCLYIEQILKIRELTEQSTKQLIIDIGSFCGRVTLTNDTQCCWSAAV